MSEFKCGRHWLVINGVGTVTRVIVINCVVQVMFLLNMLWLFSSSNLTF